MCKVELGVTRGMKLTEVLPMVKNRKTFLSLCSLALSAQYSKGGVPDVLFKEVAWSAAAAGQCSVLVDKRTVQVKGIAQR